MIQPLKILIRLQMPSRIKARTDEKKYISVENGVPKKEGAGEGCRFFNHWDTKQFFIESINGLKVCIILCRERVNSFVNSCGFTDSLVF